MTYLTETNQKKRGVSAMHDGRLYLITGATGMVGRYLTEELRKEGAAVRTLVRQKSQAPWLTQIGAEVIQGDLEDRDALTQAAQGVTHLIHTAAKVGDWGPIEEYRKVNVDGLKRLLEAVSGPTIQRVVHLSSLGVYAAKDHQQTDESVPIPTHHMDGYTQSKVEAEQLALDFHRTKGLPIVILRPGFIYGPHDRTVVPNLLSKIESGDFKYIGSGQQALNCIFVGNLVEGIRRALEEPKAIGQIFNLTDGEAVSKRRFVETLCTLLGRKNPSRLGVPLPIARLMAWSMESWARLIGAKQAPLVTKAKIKFLGLNLDFSIEKAKSVLGYRPRVGFDQGMKLTVDWLVTQR